MPLPVWLRSLQGSSLDSGSPSGKQIAHIAQRWLCLLSSSKRHSYWESLSNFPVTSVVAISLKFEAVCLYDYVWQKKTGIARDAALQYHLLSIITVAYVHIIVALKSSICISSFDKMTTFDIPISIKYCHAKYLDTFLY